MTLMTLKLSEVIAQLQALQAAGGQGHDPVVLVQVTVEGSHTSAGPASKVLARVCDIDHPQLPPVGTPYVVIACGGRDS